MNNANYKQYFLWESELFGINLFNQSVCMSPTVHHEQHVADIDIDGTCQLTVEEDVAGQWVPVAVEGQTQQFALAIEDGWAG